MATRFVVLGSDEEGGDRDLLDGEEVNVQDNRGCIVLAELEPNIGLTAPPTAPQTPAAGPDLHMTALDATMSIQSPERNISQSAVQDATMQDSPASSEKRYSVPGMYRHYGHPLPFGNLTKYT